VAKRKISASVIIRLAGTNWVDPDDARRRLDERDLRAASDTRTAAQRLLGDPPADRSALSHSANPRAPAHASQPSSDPPRRVPHARQVMQVGSAFQHVGPTELEKPADPRRSRTNFR